MAGGGRIGERFPTEIHDIDVWWNSRYSPITTFEEKIFIKDAVRSHNEKRKNDTVRVARENTGKKTSKKIQENMD